MEERLSWFGILKEAAKGFSKGRVSQLGAALAYYAIFSISPLLLIAVAIAGFVFGQSSAQGEIIDAIKTQTGPEIANIIHSMLKNAAKPKAGLIATILGAVTLAFGAVGVLKELKCAMNTVWEVAPRPSPGIWYYVKTYLFSFLIVIVVGLLLLASLLISMILSVAETYFDKFLPGGAPIWNVANIGVSFAIITCLFAIIFKFLPDVFIHWKDVWPGAIITSILFILGKFGLGWYLGHGTAGSAFGAAGSLVILLIWVYWSSQIFLFGAGITKVWADSRGGGILPKPYAMKIRHNVPIDP